MYSKKERFESLRLDFQEFDPQEYCATCYVVTVPCSSEGYISTRQQNNSGTSHSSNGDIIEILYFKDVSPTVQLILERFGNYQVGYTAPRNQDLNKGTQGYIVKNHFFLPTSNGYSTETYSDSNVSG